MSVSCVLQWIPEPPPVKKKKFKQKQSLLSGFGSSSMINEAIEEDVRMRAHLLKAIFCALKHQTEQSCIIFTNSLILRVYSVWCCSFSMYDSHCGRLHAALQEIDEKSGYDPFPRSEYMKKFKGRAVKPGHFPAPDRCILEMVNTQLMVSTAFTVMLDSDMVDDNSM